MVTWTLQSRHAVFPVPNVSGLTNTSRYTVISSGRQTGRGRSDVLTSEWTQRSAVGEDLRFFADVRDFHFGCVGDLGTIPNSILTSTVNRNKSVLDKSMSSHMCTIHHCILGIQQMRNRQSTNLHLYHSPFLEFSKKERVIYQTYQIYKFLVLEFKTKGRKSKESTYQILSSILVCTPGANCWLPNSQGHWLMGIQSPLSFRA